ncbi:MAG: hypothetical protein EBX36_05925, partial [Planctomycetia bacterium]|nr:hypothetical protein [Planctomycetia bacterium]
MLLDQRSLVPLLDARRQQGGVAFGQLLEPLLPRPQLAVEPLPFAADRGPALGGEFAFDLFPGPHDRLADARLDLPRQPLAHRRLEVFGGVDGLLQLLEFDASLIGVGHHQVAGVAEPHRGLLLELLRPHAAEGGDLGQFVGLAAGHGGREHVVGGRRGREIRHLPGDRVDDRGGRVVGIATERRLREPQRRIVGPGRLGLSGERGQRGGLAADGAAGEVETLAAEQRQKRPRGFAGVAGEFLEVGVLLRRPGRR